MPRPRRYRALLIFAVVFVVVFLHFSRSRDWQTLPPALDHHHSDPDHYSDHHRPVDYFAQRPPSVEFVPQYPPSPPPPQSPQSGKGHSVDDSENKNPPTKTTGSKNKNKNAGFGLQKQRKLGNMFPQSNSKQSLPHWKKLPEQFPLASEVLIKLPTGGKAKPLPRLQAKFKDEAAGDKPKRLERLAAIRDTFEHAWAGYKASAMGHDELMPLRGGFRDPFNGWGATLVDTLDTLWIMDLKEEFAIAVDQIRKIAFTTSERVDIPVFETAIRYLGGLLGAYDVSGHKYPALLDKAVELAEILIGVFDTSSRMPILYYQWAPEYVPKPHRATRQAVLAEIGSLSLEFTRLAQLTKEDKYYDAIARITNELEKIQSSTRLPGLWPTKVDATGCEKPIPEHDDHHIQRDATLNMSSPVQRNGEKPAPTDIESYTHFLDRRDGLAQGAQLADYSQIAEERVESQENHSLPEKHDCKRALKSRGFYKDSFSLGAQADSTYEYLPKEYMLLGGQNEQYRTMYEKAMAATREHLLFRPMVKHGRNLRFLATIDLRKPLAEVPPDQVSKKYEGSHLACFAGGMFAVGAKLFDIKGDMDIAAKLTDGCVWAYESTYTGLMPEAFQLVPCKKGEPCTWNEKLYKDALDPYREERLAAIKATEQNLKLAKGGQGNMAGIGQLDPSLEPTPDGIVARREGIIAAQTPTPSNKVNIAKRGLLAPAPGESFTLSDEYVRSRLQNERLPPGITDIPSRAYLLRPEAIESIFIMYRLTGDDSWREKGWKMFEAVSKHTRTEIAHSSIEDVTAMNPLFLDRMESFWLAETLKYFYLLFCEPGVVDLDEFVLNTEAHPLKRPA